MAASGLLSKECCNNFANAKPSAFCFLCTFHAVDTSSPQHFDEFVALTVSRALASSMAASDASGLFSNSAAPGSPTPGSSVGPASRREKLYWYDSVACQMLNPYGDSAFTDQSTEAVWRAAAQGNKRVAFHTELAAADEWRQGVGISCSAEALLASIRTLETEV